MSLHVLLSMQLHGFSVDYVMISPIIIIFLPQTNQARQKISSVNDDKPTAWKSTEQGR